MRIAVLIKEVPDTWGERRMDPATGRVDRTASDAVLDEIGERAVEAALAYQDENSGTEVVVISMGPTSVPILRKALAMGATSAVHIVDDELTGADLGWTAAVLAAAVRRIGFDLVITGNESTDGRGGVIPAMLAEHLGVASVTALGTLEISPDRVSGTRQGEDESLVVGSVLPAVVSITERMPEARFPSFKGTMGAKKKPLETLSLADLEADLDGMGTSVVTDVQARPERAAGTKVVDTGDAADQLADFLASRRLISGRR
jgi:electron transfer flavoprotein beta subunit